MSDPSTPALHKAISDPELVGHAPCLDFANTTDGGEDRFTTYRSLVGWGYRAGLLTRREATRLASASEGRPREAAAVLRRARRLRELFRRIFGDLAAGERPSDADIERLNHELADSLGNLRILRRDSGFTLGFPAPGRALDAVLWGVVRSAANLLSSDATERVRRCAAPDCDWLFLDRSRNHSRRWCDMSSCGNRVKARRHYARRRGRS